MTTEEVRVAAYSLWSELVAEHERYSTLVRSVPTLELRVEEDYRRYLCVRCAGFLEQVVFILLTHFLSKRSAPASLAFAGSYFRQAPNLSNEALTKLIARFGSDYQERIELFLTDARKQRLGDLLGARNDVAHGRVGRGRRLDPEGNLRLCREVYDWLIAQFLD